MTTLLHPFSRRLQSGGGAPFDGEYHITPITPGQGERHSHEHYELYIHLHGGNLFSLERKLFPLEPNQLVIIPPYRMHGLISDQPLLDYERMFLYISPETLSDAGAGLVDLPALLEKATSGEQYAFSLTEEDAQRCKRCICRLQACQQAEGLPRFDAWLCMLEYLQIVAHAVESAAPAEAAHAPNAVYPLIQRVMNHLDSHFTEPISLQDVADEFHLSVSHLCHEFARYNRHSIYDYVIYRRVIAACAMIRRGTALTEVAYRCGFGNYNSFLRAFRKFIGVSPREYSRHTPERRDSLP